MHIKLKKSDRWNLSGLKNGPFIEGKKDEVIECSSDHAAKMIGWGAAKSHNPTKKETAAKDSKEAASQTKAEKSEAKEKVDDAKAEPKKEGLLDKVKNLVSDK